MGERKQKSSYDMALDMLSRRGYAVKELEAALLKKSISGDEVRHVLQRLLEKKFLDDAAYASGRARYRATVSGWGRSRIQRELTEKGVEDSIAQEAVKALTDPEDLYAEEHDFQERANSILSRRFKPLFAIFPEKSDFEGDMYKEYQKEIQRRVAFLVRRGFSLDEAKKALEFCEKEAE